MRTGFGNGFWCDILWGNTVIFDDFRFSNQYVCIIPIK